MMDLYEAASNFTKANGSSMFNDPNFKESFEELNVLVSQRNKEISVATNAIMESYRERISEIEDSIALMATLKATK